MVNDNKWINGPKRNIRRDGSVIQRLYCKQNSLGLNFEEDI